MKLGLGLFIADNDIFIKVVEIVTDLVNNLMTESGLDLTTEDGLDLEV